ncbi:hypothetical protein PCASD_09964 [Puccinia coronata f. sp. avenae]|uniref:Uncharacterized protein n=1 Tax=Puccinia coronata f. sp. avenae TaxID=200324 RepID=A0A2N5UV55_9BASI|nr:hypothetical protein PCASD_09964 [Puccinia coronata f. sp. avenae]
MSEMANHTQVPVAGVGTCLKFQTNWAPTPAPAPAQAGTPVQVAGTRVQVADNQYMLVIELGELLKLAAGLGELPKLAAGFGELSKLNLKLGERISTGH